MRIKILIIGDDPSSVIADSQLLRDRGLLVFTAFNLQNLPELIMEVKPDILFFDAQAANSAIVDIYDHIVNSIHFSKLPVIYTLSEDDVYLVSRKKAKTGERKKLIADNIIDAIRIALTTSNSYKQYYGGGYNRPLPPAMQLQLPIYFQ